MIKIKLFPGSIGLAVNAISLFGRERVTVGAWMEPVIINSLTVDEYKIAQEYYAELNLEHGLNINIEIIL